MVKFYEVRSNNRVLIVVPGNVNENHGQLHLIQGYPFEAKHILLSPYSFYSLDMGNFRLDVKL